MMEKAAFSELGIAFESASHEPVTTVEAGLAAVGGLDCVFAKNLFVKDKKAGCFLLTVAHDTAVNMKSLPALLKTPGAAFRFADEKTLTEKLDVVQGAVTPLAVINDGGGAMKLVLDAKLQGAKKVGVHPLRNDMTVAREEIFGPVLSIIPFDTEDEAVEIANETPYGLASYVQSGSLERSRKVARRLRAGMVHLNGASQSSGSPFGGYKQSGNGREGGEHGLMEFLELKAISGWKPGEK